MKKRGRSRAENYPRRARCSELDADATVHASGRTKVDLSGAPADRLVVFTITFVGDTGEESRALGGLPLRVNVGVITGHEFLLITRLGFAHRNGRFAGDVPGDQKSVV